MDHAERAIAVLDGVGNDAQSEKIVDLVERDFLPLELLIDRVGALHAGFHARRNALAAQFGFNGLAHSSRYSSLAVRWLSIDVRDLGVGFGIEILECEIFQFAADLAHAEAVGDGGVNFQGLARDTLAALGAQSSPASACCAAGRPA